MGTKNTDNRSALITFTLRCVFGRHSQFIQFPAQRITPAVSGLLCLNPEATINAATQSLRKSPLKRKTIIHITPHVWAGNTALHLI